MRPAPRTAQELAALVHGTLEGCATAPVRGMNSIDEAGPDEATFIVDDRYASRWATSRAGVALVARTVDCAVGDASRRALVRVDHAELALATALEAFAPPPETPADGVHPSAVVDPSAVLGTGVAVGPNVTVGRGANVGAGCRLHAGCSVGAHAVLGARCTLHAGAVIRERCRLGEAVVVHANAVIGSDGFGYRPAADGRSLVRIPHLGTVVLEDAVEIGAGTCVDRAKFGATVIGAGTKIDNLCQIGHGCRVGRMVVIAGLTGLAGSVTVGDGVQIGGGCGIADHRTIGRGARLAARSAVMDDVPEGATWGGMPAQDVRAELRVIAAIRRLPEWSRRLRHLVEDPGKAP
ncbi:MAG: UDP-3-O-(3-hydroxymyristoyl)glucosamine N-acyltransferase [Acidobacteria bacterium]|nr:UDP-3-O-(3-hydroxymyristoyl)glucosamine N-acyltransferase [Acidobacteriota bacterium]